MATLRLYHRNFRAMGCQVNVWLEADANGEAILQHIPEQFEGYEDILSRFRPDSELSQLNRRAGQWVKVSPILLENLHAARQAARLTEGLYNPLILEALIAVGYDRPFAQMQTQPEIKGTLEAVHIPAWDQFEVDLTKQMVWLPAHSQVDLGGIAKGWAAEMIANQLSKWGSCLVDVGGDLVARGRAWDVTVAEAGDAEDVPALVNLKITNASVVTTGIDYRHWIVNGRTQHHIIDPRTGQPADTDVLTVTIIHPHAPTAEAFAKGVFLLGSDAGLEWLHHQWQGAGLVTRNDGTVLASSRFLQHLTESL
ncbi:MAG: FAD:protein FMN transferase [Anaerolineae bacterium]|nr:FAD:protein FMN transferase [Anaerolineae bacterium]